MPRAMTRTTTPKQQRFADRLGPGLITGAADDDPSGIATYSQAGAQFRFSLVWTLFLTLPMMIGIQMLSARIGWVTRRGLASNIDAFCPRWLTVSLIGLLVVANTINIAADIAAMADAVRLLAGGSVPLYALGFGALSIITQIRFSYESTVRILKWLTLALFAYVAVVLAVHVPWHRAIERVAAAVGVLPGRRHADKLRGHGRRRARAPRSVPTCSSGRPRKRSRTPAAIRKPRTCARTRSTCESICRASSRTRGSA